MKRQVQFLISAVLFLGVGWGVGLAQVTTSITSDGTMGTTVTPAGSVYTITGGTRPGAGTNLFHSFGDFSVATGNTANFFNDTGLPTTNILSRVTGGNPSNIFGTIMTTDFGGANLWLINPAGVIFGPTASLDVGGSFHASTADYIRFSDNTRFTAMPGPQDALLTSASPAAFGFLNASPADITLDHSALAVPSGQTLSLVGGDVTMTGGTLSAPGGRVNVASVASRGEVLLPNLDYGPNINGQSFTQFGAIRLSDDATLDASDNAGGTVLIKGGRLVMTGASVLADTVTGNMTTGVVVEVANDVTLRNLSFLQSGTTGSGRSGDVNVTASSVNVSGLSAIVTSTGGAGQAGDVNITSTGAVTVTGAAFGTPSQITSQSNSGGETGSVHVTAGSVSVDTGGTISTLNVGGGPAGDVAIAASGNVSVTSGGAIKIAGGAGASGVLSITAGGTVTVSGSAALPGDAHAISNVTNVSENGANGGIAISAASVVISGADVESEVETGGGGVTISASGPVTISGGANVRSKLIGGVVGSGADPLSISAGTLTIDQSRISTTASGDANAASLSLHANAGDLTISGGSEVIAFVTGSPTSLGQGGPITLTASGSVLVSGGSTIESSNLGTQGLAGDIAITANQVSLSEGSTISAQSLGTGNAGTIRITASDSLVMQSSSITTQTVSSDGGDISIQVGRLVQLTDSRITTSVQGGLGNGGNITIDPQFVILQNSQILAQAFGGNGGNILIVCTAACIIDPSSTVSASSTLGISGTVDIQTPVNDLSGTLAPLTGEYVSASELLQARCAARLAGGTASSFVVAGRDGLPLEPGGLLPSPLFVERQGSPRLARSLDVPGLRFGRALEASSLALVPLEMGCAS
jgi:filamentous hemagglutinin family protein